jgi:predicted nucleic acid-binding protein
MSVPEKVLDSWALIAWIRDEPPAQYIEELFSQAERQSGVLHISWIHIGEVYYMISRKAGVRKADQFLAKLPLLPVTLHVPEPEIVIEAARLKANHRISYADGFAAALALKLGAPVVTGDPELRALQGIVQIDWIGPA